jgi:hypothetical protein
MRCLLLLFVLACAVPAGLHATVAVRLGVDELADNAAVIVRAEVTAREARWDAAGRGIWTHHDVKVHETLKGDHADTREFVTRGGVVGDIGQHVSGSGNFGIGEEYVFFLWRDAQGRLQLVGMIQGALKVSGEGDERRVSNSFSGLTLVDPNTMEPLAEPARVSLDMTLKDLRARVEQAAKEDAAKEDAVREDAE